MVAFKCGTDGVVVAHFQGTYDGEKMNIVASINADRELCKECKLRISQVLEGAWGEIPASRYVQAAKPENQS